MNKQTGVSWFLFIIVLIWAISLNSKVNDLQKQVDNLESENTELTNVANDLNEEINNARYEAWSSYQNMGQTLEDLKNY